ncbi:MAG: carbohydrate-binding family 9-like protein [Clostridia bacterium]|nr:carbohydrate-binding family 9-like protein [Clostridia bacterium]
MEQQKTSLSYTAPYMETPDWSRVPEAHLVPTPSNKGLTMQVKAQCCHSKDKLFIRMQATEYPYRAELTGLLDMVCEDSCLEFFFAPNANEERYFNFEWNPIKTLYLGFGTGRSLHVRQIVENAEKIFSPKPFFFEGGWGIEYEIPLSFIQLYCPGYAFTGEAACNFYKCGELAPIDHGLYWSPITGPVCDFHRRCDFAPLYFGE